MKYVLINTKQLKVNLLNSDGTEYTYPQEKYVGVGYVYDGDI